MKKILATAMGLAMTAELMTGCSTGNTANTQAPTTTAEAPSSTTLPNTSGTTEVPTDPAPLTTEQEERKQTLLEELDYLIACTEADPDQEVTYSLPTRHDFFSTSEQKTFGLAFGDFAVAGIAVDYTAAEDGRPEQLSIDMFAHDLRDPSSSVEEEFLTATGDDFTFGDRIYTTQLFAPLVVEGDTYETHMTINRLRDGQLSVNTFCMTQPPSLSDLEGTPS
jgi:hypothetical protein